MVYGKTFLPSVYKSKEDKSVNLESISLAYNEYTNRLSLLESCTNDSERQILEAQVQVLYEVSIKEIIGKIKEAWFNIKKKFLDVISKIIERLKPLLQKLTYKDYNGEEHNLHELLSSMHDKNRMVALKVANQVNEYFDRFCSEGNLKLYTLSLYSKEGKGSDMYDQKPVFNLVSNKVKQSDIFDTFKKTITDLMTILDQRFMYLANRDPKNLTEEDQNKAEEFAEKLDYLKSLKYDITYERYEYRYRNKFNNLLKNVGSAVLGISGYIKAQDCVDAFNSIIEDVYMRENPYKIILFFEDEEQSYKKFIENMAKKIDKYDADFNKALAKLQEFEDTNNNEEVKTTALSTKIDTNSRSGRVKSFHSAVGMIKDMMEYSSTLYHHIEANSIIITKFCSDRVNQLGKLAVGFNNIMVKNGFANYRQATDEEIQTGKAE